MHPKQKDRANEPDERKDAERKEAGQTRNIRLTESTYKAWKLWCELKGMSYEKSMVFFLNAHQIASADIPKKYPGFK